MPDAPPRLLIVEDDRTARELYAVMLRGAGYEVVTAADLAAALVEIERLRPDAIILDLHLPSGSGLDLLRRLREHAPPGRVPVAIITADYFLDESVPRNLAALGAEIRFKPLWEEDLIEVARDLLRQAV